MCCLFSHVFICLLLPIFTYISIQHWPTLASMDHIVSQLCCCLYIIRFWRDSLRYRKTQIYTSSVMLCNKIPKSNNIAVWSLFHRMQGRKRCGERDVFVILIGAHLVMVLLEYYVAEFIRCRIHILLWMAICGEIIFCQKKMKINCLCKTILYFGDFFWITWYINSV